MLRTHPLPRGGTDLMGPSDEGMQCSNYITTQSLSELTVMLVERHHSLASINSQPYYSGGSSHGRNRSCSQCRALHATHLVCYQLRRGLCAQQHKDHDTKFAGQTNRVASRY